ncbi:Rhodopirellula transposase family protein [Candidatus Magnetomorum sp. HK-1]|nr:Rhodopirellula transposase family protein [Candidatus Magnetomorum sp. HK-1]
MVDCLEKLWPTLKEEYSPDTIVLNLDNGPENNSRRTQFIKRIVDFALLNTITVKLAYYPPYHSKYNPVERVWGVLENHWNGEILDSTEKVLGMARSMTYNGINPIVTLVEGEYLTGVKLDKAEMVFYEDKIVREPNLEKWFVTIPKQKI